MARKGQGDLAVLSIMVVIFAVIYILSWLVPT